MPRDSLGIRMHQSLKEANQISTSDKNSILSEIKEDFRFVISFWIALMDYLKYKKATWYIWDTDSQNDVTLSFVM